MPAPQKIRATVDEVIAHGERVYTVRLRPERQAPRFRAGQFLHLALDPYDPTGFWPESRVFSIASAPASRDRLTMTFSAQGRFTQRMEAELQPGRQVWLKLPYGEFVIEPRGAVVLLAGGTGITAFTAFLEQLTPESDCHVWLAYGARRSSLLVYRKLVEQAVASSRRLTPLFFVEDSQEPNEITGHVAIAPLWPLLPQPLHAHYFIAGPPAMIDTLREDLLGRDVESQQIYIDAWE